MASSKMPIYLTGIVISSAEDWLPTFHHVAYILRVSQELWVYERSVPGTGRLERHGPPTTRVEEVAGQVHAVTVVVLARVQGVKYLYRAAQNLLQLKI